MRKSVILLLVGSLVVGGLGVNAVAKKKKKKKKVVAVQQDFFLRSTGCSEPDVNFDYLSLTDADEEIQCFYTGAGGRNSIGDEAGDVCAPDPLGGSPRCAVASRATATRYFDAVDGTPIVLNTKKPVTGSIWTSGGSCVVAQACSPAGLGIGQTTMDVSLVGKIGDEEVPVGEMSDTYQVTPGTVHEVVIEMEIDAAAAGKKFDTIELRTWQGGTAAGHGVINTNGETSSFISVPSLKTKK